MPSQGFSRRAAVRGSLITIGILTLGCIRPATADSLRHRLHTFISNASTPTTADVVDPLSTILSRVVARGIALPTTATAPGVVWEYDDEAGAGVRVPGSLGPTFGERADTCGRGHWNLQLSYLYADLTDEGGVNFGKRLGLATRIDQAGGSLLGAFQGRDFSLRSHVVSFSATYGLTERWDANLVIPVVQTTLDLTARAGIGVSDRGIAVDTFRFADLFDNDAFGIGDLRARSKYRFIDGAVKIAGLLELRIPTGAEDDFHGMGDVTITPSLTGSVPVGRHEVHGHAGLELNGDDLQRTRARYGLGFVLQPIEWLGVAADLFGSSSLQDDEFEVPYGSAIRPVFPVLPSAFVRRVERDRLVAFVPRSDIIDAAIGIRLKVGERGLVFLSAIVPVTRDGLRAEVMPAGGAEIRF